MSKKFSYSILQPPYDAKTFYLEEYKSLKAEIFSLISERRKVESQVFIGVFAIYGWLLIQSNALSLHSINIDNALLRLGFGLPIVIIVLGFIRWFALMLSIKRIAEYLIVLEPRLTLGSDLSWERHLSKRRQGSIFLGQIEGWAESIAWALLLLMCIGVYVWLFIYTDVDFAGVSLSNVP